MTSRVLTQSELASMWEGNGVPTPPEPDPDIDTFLNESEPEYEWVVPGLIEVGDRLIITGPEGAGKSTLLRQFGMQIGAGIHPFSLDPIPPVNVMYVDLENSKRQVRRKLRPLRIEAGKDMNASHLRMRVMAEGIDLLRSEDQALLEERIAVNHPAVVIMGPLYKLVGGDPTEERPAKIAAECLDRLRAKYAFALVMEAHVPHGTNGAKRPERPYGASLWMRWPEFGLFLDPGGALRPWRGGRDEREWPTLLQRGGEWPWMAVTDAKAVTFARILDEVRKAGKRLPERELAMAIGGDKNQVHRAIETNRAQWDQVCGEVERGEF